MSVKEYLATFRSLAAKLHNWPESLLVDYYCDRMSSEIMSKAIEQANPDTLVSWIQLAVEIEARQCSIKSLRQARSPAPVRKMGGTEKEKPRLVSTAEATHKHFKTGRCLKLGGGAFCCSVPLNLLHPYHEHPGKKDRSATVVKASFRENHTKVCEVSTRRVLGRPGTVCIRS